MRYVKFQTSVMKVVDENVEDDATIHSILSALKSSEITCTIRLQDGPKLTNVRIDKITDTSLSFRMINRNSTLSKSALFADLDYLEVNTDADLLCRNKPNVSRWTLLDPSSSLPDEDS